MNLGKKISVPVLLVTLFLLADPIRAEDEAKKFVVHGWEEGLTGELDDKGKAIAWSNGTTWKRP